MSYKIHQVGRRYKIIRKSNNEVVQVTTSRKKAVDMTLSLQKDAKKRMMKNYSI